MKLFFISIAVFAMLTSCQSPKRSDDGIVLNEYGIKAGQHLFNDVIAKHGNPDSVINPEEHTKFLIDKNNNRNTNCKAIFVFKKISLRIYVGEDFEVLHLEKIYAKSDK